MGYAASAWERAMTVQEVVLKALSGEIHWFRAADILGMSARTLRRWRERYEEYGYVGLVDKRRQIASALNALAIRRKSLPSTHWRISYTEALLGSCLGGERRFDEAEPLLLAGYETLRAKRGEARDETRMAASGLVALYAAWGKPDRAAEWRKKLGPTKDRTQLRRWHGAAYDARQRRPCPWLRARGWAPTKSSA
jgi:hypothetical protein